MTKISDLTALTGAGVDTAADLLPIVDMSAAGAARNKKITIDEARIGLGLGTAASPQFTGINLGHASDTTITRASAGVVAVEGINIVTTAGATFTGDIIVPAEVYGVGWNGSDEAPTKNDLYDKIESIAAGSGIDIEDEGVSEATGATTLNFVGAGVTATDMGAGVVDVTISGGSSDGNLIGIQTITATGAGTYTPTAGTNSIVIELVGGGGGGAGVPQPTGTNGAAGRGGGAGAYLRKRLTSDFSGAAYVVGAKGAGGAAGNNAGSAGSDTTFTATGGGGTVYTAAGGGGGTSDAGGPVPRLANATSGAAATNGDINITGGGSQRGILVSTSTGFGSAGGVSHYAGHTIANVVAAVNTSSAGSNASGKGGGGNGAIAVGTGAAVAGGDGSDGMIIIWEYS